MGNERRGTGALPPPEFEWQIGKTAATIRFVKEAQEAIESGVYEPFENEALRAEIDALKAGAHSLDAWVDVDEFLKTQHD